MISFDSLLSVLIHQRMKEKLTLLVRLSNKHVTLPALQAQPNIPLFSIHIIGATIYSRDANTCTLHATEIKSQ
jgi:hypothetical protein